MFVDYDVVDFEKINVNLTVQVPFPGKLLLHIFVRKLSNEVGGSHHFDLIRWTNRDLCKLLDSLRNITVEGIPGESLLPSTFVVACPLVPGFYFVKDSAIDSKLAPFLVPDGRYMVLLELMQVYEEVMKLVSCRIKLSIKTPPGYTEPSLLKNSEESETTEKPVEKNEEASTEVTQPKEDNSDASADYE
ncbi:uncharacterized protein LOC6544274 [Drosophila erecta]|uniref:Uncharacterized protein n=1 Tax=Drosophila erecta TaxID=7220 RepID=B3NG85_DROER|nr:uncharacterized protein LOC6544274 [Drosophila erecta]EDV50986.2 uncharacterized protein Dere_GG15256 [Drosophila erecta]